MDLSGAHRFLSAMRGSRRTNSHSKLDAPERNVAVLPGTPNQRPVYIFWGAPSQQPLEGCFSSMGWARCSGGCTSHACCRAAEQAVEA